MRACVAAARSLRERGMTYYVATVVDVDGSSYRKPGARMILSQDCWVAGSISGGCLELDVVKKAAWYTREGSRLVSYDTDGEERSGSGCVGTVHVLVERGADCADDFQDPINIAAYCLEHERNAGVATVIRSASSELRIGARYVKLASGRQVSNWRGDKPPTSLRAALEEKFEARERGCQLLRLENADVLLEVLEPPIHLFVFGAMHDAVPLLTLARLLGWSTTLCDRRSDGARRERAKLADRYLVGNWELAAAALDRCARPAAVVMTHDYDADVSVLAALLSSRAPYIGLLGSRGRAARLLAQLESSGIRGRARVHAPVGLRIGAETPQEIALSIVAHIQAESRFEVSAASQRWDTPWEMPL